MLHAVKHTPASVNSSATMALIWLDQVLVRAKATRLGVALLFAVIVSFSYTFASKAYEKVNTIGTGENLFILVLELVPEPGHGAEISAQTPAKSSVQTGRCPCQSTGHGHL